jgi:hypothetical protein
MIKQLINLIKLKINENHTFEINKNVIFYLYLISRSIILCKMISRYAGSISQHRKPTRNHKSIKNMQKPFTDIHFNPQV